MTFDFHRSIAIAVSIALGGACFSLPDRGTGLPGSGGNESGGSSGSGGTVGGGGATASGGVTAGPSGGTVGNETGGAAGRASGGTTGSGTGGATVRPTGGSGAQASGGVAGPGGQTGEGGTSSQGGAMGTGGRSGTGGATGAGGTSGSSTGTGGSTTGAGGATTTSTGAAPCDIYKSSGMSCAAAHSTIRALFSSYSGKLYQLRKSGSTKDITTLSAGGFADSAAHDTFCSGGTCELLYIYDQTGNGLDLTWQSADSPVGGKDKPANASKEKLTVGGHSVYSVYIDPSTAYWVDGSKKGMPLGKEPQGIYMVTSGTHFNDKCCFDYGSGETSRKVESCGTMDALYFGSSCWFGGCSGSGPWVEHDPECGIYPGGGSSWPSTQKAFPQKYVTAMMKNDGTTLKLKGADATTGPLTTVFSGKPGFTPAKQGAIILGSGGDCCYSNSNQSQGTFYEGAIVKGYPSDATDDAIQANIVATKYGAAAAMEIPRDTAATATSR